MNKPSLLLHLLSIEDLRTLLKEVLDEKLSTLEIEREDMELITRKEAADFLGVSLPTLHKKTKSGILVGYRIGSQLRYRRDELLQNTQIQNKTTKK